MGWKKVLVTGRRMWRIHVAYLLMYVIATTSKDGAHADNFTVSYLAADRTDRFVKLKQGRIISGAMTLAINSVNRNKNILRDHTLSFTWGDTHADTLVGTKLLTHMWANGSIAFFGPEDSCDVEARVAAAWNLPMIAYVSNFKLNMTWSIQRFL